MAERGTLKGEAQRGWQRFWALPWIKKGPLLALVVIICAAAIGNLAGGSDEKPKQAQAAAVVTQATTPSPPASPTASSAPLTFEQQVMKSYKDNQGFIGAFAADIFNVAWDPSTGELDIEVFGQILTNGDALTRAAASGIVASKAIWTTYPDVQDLVVRLYVDAVDKTTGAKSRSVVAATEVRRPLGEKFDYDGLKSLLAQDNKLWFCSADGYGIAPSVYDALGNKGCLAQRGFLK